MDLNNYHRLNALQMMIIIFYVLVSASYLTVVIFSEVLDFKRFGIAEVNSKVTQGQSSNCFRQDLKTFPLLAFEVRASSSYRRLPLCQMPFLLPPPLLS